MLPDIDAGSSILSGHSVASKIYSTFRDPVDAVLAENRKVKERAIVLERQHRQYEDEIDLFQRRFKDLSGEISDLGGEDSNMNSQERERFLRLVAELDELEIELRHRHEKKLCIELEKEVTRLR
ncbi:MAG: hypothetical protein AAFY09_13490 [Pseudomonadota bacterium]